MLLPFFSRLNFHTASRSPGFKIAVLSDEERLPNPARALARQPLPYGPGRIAVIYRSFPETVDRANIVREIRRFCRARGYLFLVAHDIRFALAMRADGIHLPERDMDKAAGLRRRDRELFLTTAVHSARSLVAANAQPLNGVFLAPVFVTESRKVKTGARKAPLVAPGESPVRAAALAHLSRHPLWALGGVTAQNSKRLHGCGFAGAGVIKAAIAPGISWS